MHNTISKRFRLAALAAAVPLGAACLTAGTASMGATAATVSNAGRSPAPDLRAGGAQTQLSGNWSGYAVRGHKGQFTGIEATWKVPAASKGGGRYSSSWVGIDGDGNEHLIQCGTEQDTDGYYGAWTELIPAASVPLANKVSAGDLITAVVKKDHGLIWTMSLRDHTKGWFYSHQFTYRTPGATLEVIEESPEVNGSIGDIANFGSVTFSGIKMLSGHKWVSTTFLKRDMIDLVDSSGNIQAQPGAVMQSKLGQHFTETYKGR